MSQEARRRSRPGPSTADHDPGDAERPARRGRSAARWRSPGRSAGRARGSRARPPGKSSSVSAPGLAAQQRPVRRSGSTARRAARPGPAARSRTRPTGTTPVAAAAACDRLGAEAGPDSVRRRRRGSRPPGRTTPAENAAPRPRPSEAMIGAPKPARSAPLARCRWKQHDQHEQRQQRGLGGEELGHGVGVAGQRAGGRPRARAAPARTRGSARSRPATSQRSDLAATLAAAGLRRPGRPWTVRAAAARASTMIAIAATTENLADRDHVVPRQPAQVDPGVGVGAPVVVEQHVEQHRRRSPRTSSRRAGCAADRPARDRPRRSAWPGRRRRGCAAGSWYDSYRAQVRRARNHSSATTRIGPSAASASRRPVGSKKPVNSHCSHGRCVDAAAARARRTASATRSRQTPTAASVNVPDMVSAKIRHSPCTIAPAHAGRRRAQPHRHVGQRERQQQQPERAGGGARGQVAPPVRLEPRAARAERGAVLGAGAEEAGLAVAGDLADHGRSSISSAGVPETPCTRSSVGVMSRSSGPLGGRLGLPRDPGPEGARSAGSAVGRWLGATATV